LLAVDMVTSSVWVAVVAVASMYVVNHKK
jgi:hypothetical protein